MKMAKTPILFLSGNCSFHNTGIGRQKIKKSVATPIALCAKINCVISAVSAGPEAASGVCPGFGIVRIAKATNTPQ